MEQHIFTCDVQSCAKEERDPLDWFTLRDCTYYGERQLVVTRLLLQKSPKDGEIHLCSTTCVLKAMADRLGKNWEKKAKKGKEQS